LYRFAIIFFLFSWATAHAQEEYVEQQKDSVVLSEKSACKFAKRAAKKCFKLAEKTKKLRIQSLANFSISEDDLLQNVCFLNERQAETLLRNSLYSYRRYEALMNSCSPNDLDMNLPELDSTYLAMDRINKSFPDGCDCDGPKQLKTAQVELRTEIKKAEITKKYVADRKNYLSKILSSNGSILKAQKSIEKVDYYFGDGMKEYCTIFQDRSKSEKHFFKLFNSLIKDQPVTDGMAALCNVETSNVESIQSQSMEEVKEQFENAAKVAGQSTDDATYPLNYINNLRKQSDLNVTQENIQLQENVADSIYTIRDEAKRKNLLSENDSLISNKSEWKKNPLKSKRMHDRLFYGLSFQADPHTAFFPSSGAFNGQIGFQLTQDLNLSLGGSYILAFNAKQLSTDDLKIPVSTNGFSLRSSLDHRLKGPIFLKGNFEISQRTSTAELQLNRTTHEFERALLLGLKFRTSKGMSKKATTEVFYDFLHESTGQSAIIFRFGIDFLPKHAFKK